MVKLLKKLPAQILRLIKDISELAYESDYKVYLVGGFVRDILLAQENFDLDIVVDTSTSLSVDSERSRTIDTSTSLSVDSERSRTIEGDGIEFAIRLAQKLEAKIIKHKRFGTATLICHNGLKIDIATARKEVYLKPAELPKVCFGSVEDDLSRRDFSINALAVSINKQDFGRVIDFFNSQSDIRKGYIRILHNRSFIDDPTRILRAIRFEQRFGFRFPTATKALILEAKKLKMLDKVQKHRLRDEIVLILKEREPLKVILRVNSLYGWGFIHKAIHIDKNTKRLLRDAYKLTLWFKDSFPRKRKLDTWIIYLIILLRNIGRKDIYRLCHEFAFKKGDRKRIISYSKNFRKLRKLLAAVKIKASRVYRLLEPFSYETILAIFATVNDKRIRANIHNFFSLYNGTKLNISGHDLKALGIKPGPHFKDMLNRLLYAKLDKRLINKTQELEFLKQKCLSAS